MVFISLVCLQKKTGQDSPDFTKEKNYFLEVDSFELLEETPSPKNFSTWIMGAKQVAVVHDLPAILERWKISKLVSQCGSSQHLFKIMETPFSVPSVLRSCGSSNNLTDKTPERDLRTKLGSHKESHKPELVSNSSVRNLVDNSIVACFDSLSIKEKEVENGEDVEILQEGHFSSESKNATQIDASQFKTSDGEYLKAFDQLLIICRQSAPISLGEVFSRHWYSLFSSSPLEIIHFLNFLCHLCLHFFIFET